MSRILIYILCSFIVSLTVTAEELRKSVEISFAKEVQSEKKEILIEKNFAPIAPDLIVFENMNQEIYDLNLYLDAQPADKKENNGKNFTFIGAVSPLGTVFYLKKSF